MNSGGARHHVLPKEQRWCRLGSRQRRLSRPQELDQVEAVVENEDGDDDASDEDAADETAARRAAVQEIALTRVVSPDSLSLRPGDAPHHMRTGKCGAGRRPL